MKLPLFVIALGLMASVPAVATAETVADIAVGFDNQADGSSDTELPPYLQCVPFARELSGIRIYGDAHSWWTQAEGKYQRGNRPQVGAVMAFQPHRNMTLGHVAAVSRIIDDRTVLISHSNWSPINGRRGQIERDVRAVDVSPDNDWSMVRVWYHPLQAVGATAWPVRGFIYNSTLKGADKPPLAATRLAQASNPRGGRTAVSKQFDKAFADLNAPVSSVVTRTTVTSGDKTRLRSDPVREAIARYER